MAENSNQPKPGFVSHSRSISTVPRHQGISFMPKFLMKKLHRKKQHHRQPSLVFPGGINLDPFEKIPGSKNDHETRGKEKGNQVMRKNVKKIMAVLFRNKKKSHDQDYSLVKEGSVSAKCMPSSLSTLLKEKKHGLKTVKGKTEEENSYSGKALEGRSLSKSRKSGLKIKGLTKIMSREKDDKRFELCKKKILMGEKCRPLSGTLRYDKNGVLVPENLT